MIGMALTVHAGKGENSLFITNENAMNRRAGEKAQEGKKNTIYAGNIGVRPDSIQIKRQQAQKKAMKILQDTFSADKELDQGMEDMAARAAELQDQNLEYRKELDNIRATRAGLEKSYDGLEDGQENADLDVTCKELDEQEKLIQSKIAGNESSIKGIRRSLGDMKIERLKSNPMLKAQDQAEEIIDSANKEILGDLINEGKKHIEEKMAEEKEKAAERAEKKEEEEEKKEAKEKQEAEMEAWIEGTKEAASSDRDAVPSVKEFDEIASKTSDPNSKTKVEKEMEEILDGLKLLQDDLKGAAVDANI